MARVLAMQSPDSPHHSSLDQTNSFMPLVSFLTFGLNGIALYSYLTDNFLCAVAPTKTLANIAAASHTVIAFESFIWPPLLIVILTAYYIFAAGKIPTRLTQFCPRSHPKHSGLKPVRAPPYSGRKGGGDVFGGEATGIQNGSAVQQSNYSGWPQETGTSISTSL